MYNVFVQEYQSVFGNDLRVEKCENTMQNQLSQMIFFQMECCSCKRQVRSLTMVPNYMRIPHMCKYAHSSSSTGSHRSWREIDAPISFEQANFGDCMCQKTTLAVSESHLPLLFLWNSIPQFPQKILYIVYRLQHPTGISGILLKQIWMKYQNSIPPFQLS